MSSLPHEKLLESPRSYQQPPAELVHQQPIGFQQPPAEPVYQQPIGYQMPSASVVSMPMIQVQAELKNAARGPYPQNIRDFSTGLCECFSDISSCEFFLD